MFRYFCLDVQIIATGSSCSSKDRAVGAICLVNEKGDEEYFALIKPNKNVSSYFERKTGLSKHYTQYGGIPFEDARKRLRERLGPDCVLVSHHDKKIPQMLGLRQGNILLTFLLTIPGKDFASTIELEDWFKYSTEEGDHHTFSLEYVLYWLLDIDVLTGVNSPFDKAVYTLCLFREYHTQVLEAFHFLYLTLTGSKRS
jgi:hypothetical protein